MQTVNVLFIVILFTSFELSEAKRSASKQIVANDPSKYGEKRFNEWTWLMAHNAHLNWHDSSVIDYASNQNMSLDEQLTHGVRGFMLDIDVKTCHDLDYWFSTCYCEGVCLCHGRCRDDSGNLVKDGFSIKKLEYALRKLVNFLVKNPSEIVTIVFENYVEEARTLELVFNKVRHLNSLVFDPYKWNVSENGWPLIKDMLKANKRLLIVDYRPKNAAKSPGIIYIPHFFIENHWHWNSSHHFNWNISDHPELSARFNRSSINVEMPDCSSVFNNVVIDAGKSKTNQPTWSNKNKLKLNEIDGKLANKDKLFLYNHFYGVMAKQSMMDPVTVELMNSKEFVMKRFVEKCIPATGFNKPNYIALDFISSNVYKDLVEPLNKI